MAGNVFSDEYLVQFKFFQALSFHALRGQGIHERNNSAKFHSDKLLASIVYS
jgi:hypothetical protein